MIFFRFQMLWIAFCKTHSFLYILRIPCRRNKGPIKKKIKSLRIEIVRVCALFFYFFFFCCSLRSHGWIERKGTDSTVFRCYGGQSLSTHPRGTFINLYNRFLFIHQWMGWMEVGERLFFYTIYMHLGGCESVAEYKFAAHCREPLIKKWHAWQAGALLPPLPLPPFPAIGNYAKYSTLYCAL